MTWGSNDIGKCEKRSRNIERETNSSFIKGKISAVKVATENGVFWTPERGRRTDGKGKEKEEG